MFRVLAFFASVSLLAQTPATRLGGQVTDPQGKAIQAATVRLSRVASTEVRSAETDSTGKYSFERLAPGDFVFEVDKSQFRRDTRLLHFEAGAAEQNVTLALAGINQTVVVAASGGSQMEGEISKAISVIDKAEVLSRNAMSLTDIIRYSPGVQIRNGGGIGQNTAIRIRGLRPDATAVLIDGLRFRDSTTIQGDASSFVSSLNFVSAERVEVLRGSASSLYGTNAVGGAINVVTPQGGGATHGEMQAEAGNLGLYRGRGSLSGGLFGDRLKYSAGLLHLNVGKGIDGQDAARSTGGQAFARYDLTPGINLSARFLGSDDFAQLNIGPTTTGIPAANLPGTGFPPAIPLSPAGVKTLLEGGRPDYGNATFVPGRNDPDSRRSSRFASTALVFRQTVSPLFSWQTSYQRNHTWRVFANGPAGIGSQPAVANLSRYIGDIDTAEIRATGQPAKWLTVSGGYEFEHEAYNDLQDNRLASPRRIFTQTRIREDHHSVYFATQASLLGRRLQISLSGREQSFRLAKPEFELAGTANNYNRFTVNAPPRALTGDASIAWMMAKSNTKLRAHFGNAYRAPAMYERFGAGFSNNPATGDVVFTPYGDPRLSPDRYNSVDAGVDQYLFGSRLRLSPTFFYTRIQRITGFDSSGVVNPATDPFGRSLGYINGSGGITRGVELSAEARPVRSLLVNGSYTYVNANTDRDLSVTGFFKLFTVHPHTATLVASKQWGRRLDTTVDLFHGSSHYVPFFAVTRSRAFELPGYTKTGLTASYKIRDTETGSIRAYVRIDNLFNQTYYEAGWLAAKATVVGGIGYRF